MFLPWCPDTKLLARVLDEAHRSPLSYAPVGLAQRAPPRGFRAEVEQGLLGRGDDVFDKAADALHRWRGFELGWAGIYPSNAPVQPGTDVLIIVRHLGFWSVHACRILYLLGTEVAVGDGGRSGTEVAAGDGGRVVGFAYGTLTEHAESGEEIFQISQDAATGEVTYLIRAVSYERALLARLGYPIARALQDRFRRDSVRAMRKHLGNLAT